ncbi:hypothetical protein LXA47_19370 [Massilia sp. P8910]|uniref:hypothetical protein n=1 Tax=Massilia antarctica TaxID=2765360 RepID=UPI001E522257|nr:hypothetical protein [Massilia antarctica]MCE3605748.1 hypothetical protein [Massilia antarctica]
MSLDTLIKNAGGGETLTGAFGMTELTAMNKALEAGYGSDSANLEGGAALRIQSLDTTMQATVQDNKHFALFNRLPKPNATATVDEWTEQYGVGGVLGGSTNTESGVAEEAEGDYARQVGQVKYMSTYRKVSLVLNAQNNIISAKAAEQANGALQLLSDIEYLSFEGNDAVVPTEFNGIQRQIELLDSVDHVIDMKGAALENIEPISRAAETVWGIENFGTSTDIFMPGCVQTDLNNKLDPAFRVSLNGSGQDLAYGAHVAKIKTAFGEIGTTQDVFCRDEKMKRVFQLRNASHAKIAAKLTGMAPTVAVATNASGGASSAWQTAHAGQYFYVVTGINHKGQSTAVVSGQVAVAAGGKNTITITASVGGEETGYVIYRSRKNGTNALSDFREMKRIPRTGAVTVFDDLNRDIPGSTSAFVLNLRASDHAISWKQFMPMIKIPMAAVNSPIDPWLQMICGYLRITKRRQHVVIKNIIANGQLWKPFA